MRLVPLVALLACACMTPRSVMLGQSASAIGQGAIEVGVATGVGYASQNSPPSASTNTAGQPLSTVRASHVWVLPAVEGNAAFGLGDHLSVNAHFSPAGVQPGLKITLNRSPTANVALLPQFGIGFVQYADTLSVTGQDGASRNVSPTSTSMLTFMLGLKFLISHKSGFYLGLGYDFILTRSVVTGTIGTGNSVDNFSNLTTSIQHSVAVNLGFSFPVGWLRIRPELAFSVQPSISTRFSNGASDVSDYGGYGFALIPGFSLVAATPKNTRDEGAEEDEKNVGPAEDAPPPERRDETDDT